MFPDSLHVKEEPKKLKVILSCVSISHSRQFPPFLRGLDRSDNYVVDRDEDQLDEKPYEAHHHETYGCAERDLGEFFTIGLVAPLHEADAVLRELPHRIEDVIDGIHCFLQAETALDLI